MAELLITSSVLILALLALRFVLAKRISRRLQYALWGLVLLRLLLPFQLPQSEASVMNYLPGRPVAAAPGPVQAPAVPPQNTAAPAPMAPVQPQAKLIDFTALLPFGWALGSLVCGGWLLAVNLRFGRMLKRNRAPFEAPGCKLPVFLCSEGLCTPCLYGVLRPAIYLTPQAAADPETLGYVLRHEQTHYKHADPVWGALRCVCLAAYWFHPLVWVAALASQKDCELACDETVTQALSPVQRVAYGKALVALIPARAPAGQRLLAATTQSFSAGQMKQRLIAISQNKKTVGWALALMLLAAAAVAVCTFTGAQGLVTSDPQKPPEYLQPGEMVKYRERFDLDGDGFEEEVVISQRGQSQTGALYWARPARGNPLVEVVCEEIPLVDKALIQRDGDAFVVVTPVEVINGQVKLEVWLLKANESFQRQPNGAELYFDNSLPEIDATTHAEQMVQQLVKSVGRNGSAITFTIPQTYNGPASDWNIQAVGRRVVEGIGGMSEHFFEEQNAARSWEAGQTYSIPLSKIMPCEEFVLEVALPRQPGESNDGYGAWATTGLSCDLLAYLPSAAQTSEATTLKEYYMEDLGHPGYLAGPTAQEFEDYLLYHLTQMGKPTGTPIREEEEVRLTSNLDGENRYVIPLRMADGSIDFWGVGCDYGTISHWPDLMPLYLAEVLPTEKERFDYLINTFLPYELGSTMEYFGPSLQTKQDEQGNWSAYAEVLQPDGGKATFNVLCEDTGAAGLTGETYWVYGLDVYSDENEGSMAHTAGRYYVQNSGVVSETTLLHMWLTVPQLPVRN